jgi:CHAT domain-containing protein/tetratricopeptide (TPR) repeat protein
MGKGIAGVVGIVLAIIVGCPKATAQKAGFVAPPRSIADITAILDQEKPDPAKRAKAEADAAAEPPAGADRAKLKDFYYKRGQTRASLGRPTEAIADTEKAVEYAADYVSEGSRLELAQESQLRLKGDYRGAIALLERMAQKLNVTQPPNKGRAFSINQRIAINLVNLGEIGKAETYVKRNVALLAEARGWQNAQQFFSNFEAVTEDAKGRVHLGRGQFREAEAAFVRAESQYRDALVKSRSWNVLVQQAGFEAAIDYMALFAGRAKTFQSRHAEAEIDIRRALLGRLKANGKYHADTANMLNFFSELLFEQARLKESEALARASIEIYDAIGYGRDTSNYVFALSKLGAAIFQQRRYDEAKAIFVAIDAATEAWPKERRAGYRASWSRIYAHYFTREVDKGIEYARQSLERSKTVKGENHYDTAMSRAILATGLTFARRDEEATKEFAVAIPILLGATNEGDDEDATVVLSTDRRLQTVIEAYVVLLARSTVPNRGEEAFRLAEAIRGRSVQNALAASAVRAAARTPALAEVVRKEQDLHKQALAQAGALNNLLTEPPETRDPHAVKELQQELAKLRKEKLEARNEIQRRFPEYASLTKPPPSTVDDIRAALRPDEALLSFYFGGRTSFVWAIPKQGPIAFANVNISARDLEKKVNGLREALDPPSVQTMADIPGFDVDSAHELYKLLLEPVASGWRPAKSLVVVTNGALGLLPLGLLPTEPIRVGPKEVGQPYFASYRKVAWLARTHATVSLPSAGALRTLRNVPAPTTKREQLIGFGDPYFSAEQAKEAATADASRVAAADTMRGAKVKLRASPRTEQLRSANLGMLPRLEDTGDELKAIAVALQADPTKVLYLGKDANEKVVKGTDLSRYRIVAFATHGLVPGELDGLTQPALALTAPDVADIDGDGLLTVDEILSLRLNADWVVLSACNTAAGAGAGAEAVSGLGRAFFYAGTRALLVTNWSVDSASARELVTGVFRRQAADAKLGRAEALRQSMVALMEKSEVKNDAGEVVYTYAHPLFWAPYTIMGDGG